MESEENVKETEVKDNVKETEVKETETEVKDTKNTEDQSEANDTKTETGTELDQQTSEIPENPQDVLLESQPLFTSEIIETDNFTLQIDHQMTVGDMLVATLLAANIAVILLCRLLRDRK